MSQKNLAEKANSNLESDWVGPITRRFGRLPPPPGGEGTRLYKPYRYLPSQRVEGRVLVPFRSENGYSFEGEYERIGSFNSK